MTRARTVRSSVEVPADPATAFAVFTEEIDCWWVQGPINFPDSTRALYKSFEPGVGGRVLEVYDGESGDGLELGRITVWEPGERLAWTGSLDDVTIEVRFEASSQGTTVLVEATIPAGGVDGGGSSWVRMTPVWLGDWVDRRGRVAHEPLVLDRLAVAVHYEKPAAAARYLRDVFALEPCGNVPDEEPSGPTWIEFRVGSASVMVFGLEDGVDPGPSTTHTPWIFVDDLDQHHARVVEQGGRIVQEIWEHGARAYGVEDGEGNRWTFAQATPLMRRA
jgi:predicted enzyme related to lactoylglutathione lyase